MKIPTPLPKMLTSLLLCLVCAFSASAYDFVMDGIYYNINGNGTSVSVTYKDTNYNSYSGTVNIPSTVTYNGTTYTVTSIGPSAFYGSTNLIRVVIPNSVIYLMNEAFRNCTGLLNITLPESLSAVYNNVFDGCTSLRSIICLRPNPGFCTNTNNFPTSVYSSAKLIVPQGCLTAYQSSSLWSNFSSIEEMECDFVEGAVFYNDLGNNKAAVTHVTSNYTFNSNFYTGDVVIPSTVTHGGNTYTVTSISANAFYYCHYMYSVSIPATVNNIAYYAFYYCDNLTSVNIPEGVQNINYCTFGSCSNLASVIIPSSVTWIAQNAFVNCYSLASITCRATTPPTCSDSSSFPTTAYDDATLYVPSNAVSQYQSASVWQNFYSIVGKDYDFVDNGIYYKITGANTAEVTYKDKTFNSYSGNVTIPSTVTHEGTVYTITAIGNSAFRNCTGLTGVTIPNTVTVIGYASFYQCSALTSLTIPNSVVTLEDHALRSTGLTQITIPNSVTTIGYGCFLDCSGLTSMTIPNSVTSLGSLCFQSCLSLQSVTLGTGLTVIPQQCFAMCESLTSVTIPSSVKKYDYFAFYESGLTSFVIPEGVDTIANYAFADCYNLTSISFPASVKHIDIMVLDGCSSLAQITVNGSNPNYCAVENVLYDKQQTRLIRYAPMKPEVIYNVTCPVIDQGAFDGAANLYYIVFGADVQSVGDYAFFGCSSLRQFMVMNQNPHFLSDDGVLYTQVDGKPQTLLRYPAMRPDKHYSVMNGTDTIKVIAFGDASLLESVYLPQSLKEMEGSTFSGTSVKRVVIDEGLQTLSAAAFYNCQQLQSVYLPSTLQNIEERAFAYDYSLAEVTFAGTTPPTVQSTAFFAAGYDLPSQTTTVYVPAGATSTYSSVDWNSEYFNADVTGPSTLAIDNTFTVDSLNYEIMDNNLDVKVTDPTSMAIVDPGIPPKVAYQGNLCTVQMLGDHAFQSCTNMVRAEVPFTVQKIDNYCFYHASNVEKMTLHEGLKQINGYAFAYMDKLPRIFIPSTVDSIRGGAFISDTNLFGIYVTEGNTKYTSVDGVLFSYDKKTLVSYPDAHSADYTVPDGTQVIGEEAFRGDAVLTSATLPKSLREIKGYAFHGCTSLPIVKVPQGVTTLNSYSFGNCANLAEVDLPATLTTLKYYTFYNSTALTRITVRATTPPTCEVSIEPHTGTLREPFMEQIYANATLYVPRGCAQAYRQANVWKKFQNIVEADFPFEGIRGDVNDDGEVDINDVTALISRVLGQNVTINAAAADVNYDGAIDINDVTLLINYVLGNPWPEPEPIDLWYLWGNFIGTTPWGDIYGNSPVGVSALPLYPVGEFDAHGKGVLTWSGHIPHQRFTIVHKTGDYDDVVSEMWVVDNNTYAYSVQNMVDDNPNYSTFLMDDGYYTITLNTKAMQLSIEPYLSTVYAYQAINMPGYYNDWNTTANPMTAVNSLHNVENHDWWVDNFTVTADDYLGELKFCADGNWSANWGIPEFPYGTGVMYGDNIPATSGTYTVFFNDVTGQFHFIKK